MRDDSHILGLWVAFVSASLFSIGGASALIPEFHRQIVDLNGWLTDSDFAKSVALAQIAPGPNMLIVTLIGWKVGGMAGMLASTLAIIGPPGVLAFAVGRMVDRLEGAVWLKAVKSALAPIVIGLLLASGLVTARAADNDAFGVVLTLVSGAFITYIKRNPLWIIAAGAATGIIAHRMGMMGAG